MKKHISPSNNLKNLNLIINSDTYKLGHEDIGLLRRDEMRGVRMLLEITKPDLILEENKILSTIIIFGGASITEESKTRKKIKEIKKDLSPRINNFKNLNLIINSDTYKLAHEDIGLLSRSEMRGVRMLLEITKPDLILEENKILSTIIIFGGASITEKSNT